MFIFIKFYFFVLQPLIIVDILDLCLSCINLTEHEISKQFYALIHKISLITVLKNVSICSMVSITLEIIYLKPR